MPAEEFQAGVVGANAIIEVIEDGAALNIASATN